MGITTFDIGLIEKAFTIKRDIKTVLELGSQNLYTSAKAKPPFASTLYESMGVSYTSIDLAGDNGALMMDLSEPIKNLGTYDLVTDFGSSEHVVQMEGYEKTAFHEGYINSIYPTEVKNAMAGFYNCWLNKHRFLKIGGLMINVNPKTQNWPGHGYHYYTAAFYHQLTLVAGYDILEIGEHASMNNTASGWNIYCILKKKSNLFPSIEKFETFNIQKS